MIVSGASAGSATEEARLQDPARKPARWCPVMAIPPPELARELRYRRLSWVFWHRSLSLEKILRDQGSG